MKQRIKISENFQIKEVDAEIVKIGPFYFGLFWNENEYSEHRITRKGGWDRRYVKCASWMTLWLAEAIKVGSYSNALFRRR